MSSDVYKIPSYTDQVQAEFLVGAKRWGMAIYTGTLVAFLGESSVWALQSVASMYSILALMLMSLGISARRKNRSSGVDLIIPALIALNSNLLYVLHEGGLAQIWVLPVIFAIAYLVTERIGPSELMTGLLSSALMISMMFTYFDAYLLMSGTLLVYVALLVTLRKLSIELRKTLSGLFLGLAISWVFLFEEIKRQLLARLGDAQGGGWPTPRWLSPADSFGLFDAYKGVNVLPRRGINQPFDLQDSLLTEVAVLVVSISVIAYFLIGLSSSDLLEIRLLIFSCLFVIMAIYLKTRYLDQASNYQYLKGITMLLPILFLGAASIHLQSSKMFNNAPHISLPGIFGVAITLSILANISFQENWRSSAAWTEPSATKAISSKSVRAILNDHSVLNTPGYLDSQMVVSANLRFAETGRASLNDELVVVAIDQNVCPQMHCVSGVSEESLLYSTKALKILALPLMAKDISDDPAGSCSKIATAWSTVGAMSLGVCGAW
jgi:hypothetical protein